MDEHLELTGVEKMLFDRAEKMRTPIYVGFELTPYCNLACKMCFVREYAPGLPVIDADTWLEIGRQAAAAGTLVVQLTGGEPMLHPEFKKIYSGLKKMGMVVTMNTNGTMIDEDMADFLAANMPRRMNVSIYGPNREVYKELTGSADAFDRVIRGIELMRERNIPIKANVTPTSINYPYYDEILDICRKYELPIETTTYMFEPIRTLDGRKQTCRLQPSQMADVMLKWNRYRFDENGMITRAILAYESLPHFNKAKDVTDMMPLACRAATCSCWVCWDGKMNVCVNTPKPQADVRELGFAGAWEKVKSYGETIRVPARCMACSLRMFCQSCGAMGYHENGTFEQVPQIMCDAAQEYARLLSKGIRRGKRTENERLGTRKEL